MPPENGSRNPKSQLCVRSSFTPIIQKFQEGKLGGGEED